MWEFRLIDIRLIENVIFKVFTKYIYMAFGVGCGPHICDWPGLHLTSLKSWITVLLVHRPGQVR
jgi:hypothetical protein